MAGQDAFSLVELSIVLVILGLLTGGILGGQSLIRAAELRSVTTEYNQYLTAFNTFRSKYFALPGDMRNAVQFWGQATNCPGTTAQGTTDGTTCNGDGNGRIENTNPDSNEWFRSWQHLANAGLIQGVYNGVTGSGHANWHAVIGTNVPPSKYPGSGWTLRWLGDFAGDDQLYAGGYGHMMIFGGQSADIFTYAPTLAPEQAWNIDTKFDDGMPGTGTLVAFWWDDGCTQATSFTDFDAGYSLNEQGQTCAIAFRNIFE